LPCTTILDPLPSGGRSQEARELNWFAVHARTRFEKKIVCEFEEKGIETFLPLFSSKHKWSDRQSVVHQPLFPGYVFVRISAVQNERVSVLRTIGVMNFVGARGVGTPIPDCEIRSVRTLLEQRLPFQLYPFLSVGQRVRILGGCLDGIGGILTAINGSQSLVVSVQLIQRSIALQISGYQVEPVRAAGPYLAPTNSPSRKEDSDKRNEGFQQVGPRT
jgi:transcription termination/antitermination protein NusG